MSANQTAASLRAGSAEEVMLGWRRRRAAPVEHGRTARRPRARKPGRAGRPRLLPRPAFRSVAPAPRASLPSPEIPMPLARAHAVLALALACGACSRDGSLVAATKHLGAEELTSVKYAGTGASFSLGQPFIAGQEWPQVDIVGYTAEVDYGAGSMRTDVVREQPSPEPPGGGVRFAGQQRQIQLVSGTSAWNQPPPTAADGSQPAAQPQPAAAAERALSIWTTPHGFLKAAAEHEAAIERT